MSVHDERPFNNYPQYGEVESKQTEHGRNERVKFSSPELSAWNLSFPEASSLHACE